MVMQQHKVLIGIWAAAIALTFTAASHAARADAIAEVQSAAARWVDAFNRKSTADIVALYAKDAVFFGTTSPILRDTPELIHDYFKNLANLGDASISMGEHRVQLFGDVAVNTGYYTLNTHRDGALVLLPARFTFVYQRRDGAWLIVEHHSSARPDHS
jgi:uncharacterized protein (TIGR02246 family)